MNQTEQTLAKFQTRTRQMILRFNELKKENEELYAMIDSHEKEIKSLRNQLAQKDNDYNSLKMAKMIEITDGDLKGADERLSKLIRDVNKCIALLKNQSDQ
jgi:predicted RNase H-like nuclease (RuvC/YqgF family)